MDLIKSIKLSTAGMRVQGTRLRVISENIANADSLPENQGDTPYRRKQVSFKNILDRSLDAKRVAVDTIQYDRSDFEKKFDPQHPAADKVRAAAHAALRVLDDHLTDREIDTGTLGPWIVGDRPTIADVACFPYVALSGDGGVLHDDYHAVRRWMASVKRLPGFVVMPGIYPD